MQELENQFIGTGEVKGFIFTKVFQNENGFVYKVECENSTHYEAFLRKEAAICIDFVNRRYSDKDKKVTYPKSNSFGQWAWTCKSLESAIAKLNAEAFSRSQENG